MTHFALSNLQLRTNLLSSDGYQEEMRRVTIFEVRDIWRRNSPLYDAEGLTGRQKEEWKNHLFWGQRSFSLDDDDRRRAWLERLAESVDPALTSLEERPSLEAAFELLVVTEQLKSAALGSWQQSKAAEWSRRIRTVLARDEFRLSTDVIDQRLAETLGLHALPNTATDGPLPTLLPEVKQPVKTGPNGAALNPRTEAPEKPGTPIPRTPQAPVPAKTPAVSVPASATAVQTPPAAQPAATAVAEVSPVAPARDPHLEDLIEAWPTLPDDVKSAMILLLKAVEITSRK